MDCADGMRLAVSGFHCGAEDEEDSEDSDEEQDSGEEQDGDRGSWADGRWIRWRDLRDDEWYGIAGSLSGDEVSHCWDRYEGWAEAAEKTVKFRDDSSICKSLLDATSSTTASTASLLDRRDAVEAVDLLLEQSQLHRREGRVEAALIDAQRCFALVSTDQRVLFARAKARLDLGDFNAVVDACEDLRTVLRLNPHAPHIRFWLHLARHWASFADRHSLYRLLGIPVDATMDDIRRAHRQLRIRWHPDKPGGHMEQFRLVQEAWEVLSNEKTRLRYDFGDDNTRMPFPPWYGANDTRPAPGITQVRNSRTSSNGMEAHLRMLRDIQRDSEPVPPTSPSSPPVLDVPPTSFLTPPASLPVSPAISWRQVERDGIAAPCIAFRSQSLSTPVSPLLSYRSLSPPVSPPLPSRALRCHEPQRDHSVDVKIGLALSPPSPPVSSRAPRCQSESRQSAPHLGEAVAPSTADSSAPVSLSRQARALRCQRQETDRRCAASGGLCKPPSGPSSPPVDMPSCRVRPRCQEGRGDGSVPAPPTAPIPDCREPATDISCAPYAEQEIDSATYDVPERRRNKARQQLDTGSLAHRARGAVLRR
eukprot:gnl/TRDRNA2_/TRDRNA2_170367_c2_seq1.p1 gnl/TRDRNA2_/TRDRNA2_170367_c2~~gnl/TRDRNA2_/TRDRNA2_170367_c2_seq1.p1  ORF type:complete len:607 (+),score=36.45 gnl/TRDRNA2_/TRDRNA2_170367_c2_seq1:51-1823(+)